MRGSLVFSGGAQLLGLTASGIYDLGGGETCLPHDFGGLAFGGPNLLLNHPTLRHGSNGIMDRGKRWASRARCARNIGKGASMRTATSSSRLGDAQA